MATAFLDRLKRVPGLRTAVHSLREGAVRLIPDSVFTRWTYRQRTGKNLDLRQPTTFNEKIQWIKFNQRDPLLTQLADKYSVRQYVRQAVGEKHLIPLLGVWDKPEDIPFDALPEAFVLKATHGCAWNILCRDRASLDIQEARRLLTHWLSLNYYEVGREWVYKNIPPRIVAEEFLLTPDGSDLKDYKFFCFHGEPRFIQVDVDRHTDHRRSFYDTDWVRMPFTVGYPQARGEVARPENLAEMIEVARAIAAPLRFARVDLYSHGGSTLFGEVTFYPGNGMELFDPPGYDLELGRLLDIGS